ncbi:MAG: hypothetical protein ACO1TE_14665 [Prosthecobacter sp.]
MNQKPNNGRDEPESGQQGQKPDTKGRIPDKKGQNPDNNTLYKPPEIPPEGSSFNTQKNSATAESLHEHNDGITGVTSVHPFDAPIFCSSPQNMEYGFWAKRALAGGRINQLIRDEMIMQPEHMTLTAFIEDLKARFDDVATLDDLRHDVHKEEAQNTIVGAYTWEHVFHECERNGRLFDHFGIEGNDQVVRFWIVVRAFIKKQNPELLRSLVESHDPDVTLKALAKPFLQAYGQSKEGLHRAGLNDATLKERGFYAGLELLVAGIQNAKDLVPSDELMSGLGSNFVEYVCDNIIEVVAKTEKLRHEQLERVIIGRYLDREDKVTWGKAEPEYDAFLTASQKAKLFMRTVTQLQTAGVLRTITAVDRDGNVVAVCGQRIKNVYRRKEDVEPVEAFFAERPWLAAHDLSRLFRSYAAMFCLGLSKGEGFKKDHFYSTKVISVSWFLAYMDKILHELTGRYGDRFKVINTPPAKPRD